MTITAGESRYGMPWAREDYERLADVLPETEDAFEIGVRIGRPPTALAERCRAMLPARERHIPGCMVLNRLHRLMQEEDFDWESAMREPEIKAPVTVVEEHHTGWKGLETADKVAALDALIAHREHLAPDEWKRVREALDEPGIDEALARRRIDRLVRQGWDRNDAHYSTMFRLQYEAFDGDDDRVAFILNAHEPAPEPNPWFGSDDGDWRY